MFQILTGKVPFGVYLQAAVNVQNRNREPWPGFMLANTQYKNLSLQLQAIVEKCLQYDIADRPSADEIVEEISELCFIGVDRELGTVSNLIQNGYSGFIDGDSGGTTFFSQESVYGQINRATRSNKVCYSSFPGSPRDRAHPIIVLT